MWPILLALLVFVSYGEAYAGKMDKYSCHPELCATDEYLIKENATADRFGLPRVRDAAMLKELSERGHFVVVPRNTGTFYLAEPESVYALPSTKDLIEDLARRYSKNFKGERHKITSLLRIPDDQQNLVNKRKTIADGESDDSRSCHLTGACFDISRRPMSLAQIAWMREELIKLIDAGIILAIEEGRSNAFHIFVLPLPSPNVISADIIEKEYKRELLEKLSGLLGNTERISSIFSDANIKLDYTVLPKVVEDPKEAKRLAEEYRNKILSEESINRGREYMRERKIDFDAVARRYNGKVDPEIVASILRNETNFGRFIGSRLVVNSLYSNYILRPRRRGFAFNELACLLKTAWEKEWNLFLLKGSTFGAFGNAQFMPCTYRSLAVDGNGDGVIDLFSDADSILSIVNKLRKDGWSQKKSNQRKAVLSYNPDDFYAELVLKYREKLLHRSPPVRRK